MAQGDLAALAILGGLVGVEIFGLGVRSWGGAISPHPQHQRGGTSENNMAAPSGGGTHFRQTLPLWA